MRVLVYGGGAVGLGLGSCLLKAGATVHIVGRENTIEALRCHGLLRTGLFGAYRAPAGAFTCSTGLADLPADRWDYVLVSVKSFDSAAAARDIASRPPLAAETSPIVLFQNGWGNHEAFAERVPPRRVFNARVITGFTRPEPHHVEVTVHADAIAVGSLFGESPAAVGPLCAAIARGGIPCRPTAEIGKDLWAKMLYNCALNPLGGIFGVPYGALAESPHSRRIMDDIHREAFAVMGANGYATHWATAEEYGRVFYERLVPPTAAHESSMVQDLRAGRRTEVDALNGAVVRLAGRAGLAVPVNHVVYAMVKFAERHLLEGRRAT